MNANEYANFYTIPRYIDQGRVIMGFPADEVLPVLFIFGIFSAMNYMLTGAIIGGVVGVGLHVLKQGKGDNFLPLTFYWFSPSALTKQVFKRTPSPCRKYWLN